MSEKKVVMNTSINWQEQIAVIAGPYEGNRKGWLSRAARKANTTYRAIKGLYYGEYTNPSLSTAQSILSAADQARIQEAQKDAQFVAEVFSRHAQTLANVDADFHRPSIDALIEAARVIGGRDRS
jgi:hypothetical protein